ncbi:MAG: tRNA threonylcarbamoyladenosine dehydratase [Proteobacteria bacterium]|nr:tRNA threonylcarbamoyladenosine dehydratase [Pseudomonadota bacterium]
MGEKTLARFADAHVCIVGYGAVGSFAAEALARSGVGFFRLVDGDIYAVHHINRQIGADEKTLGMYKVSVGKEHLCAIHPGITVECVKAVVDASNVGVVDAPFADGRRPDVIVDAIDTIDAKVELIVHCVRTGIPIISSMGAARKMRPSEVSFADISQTEICPLAREVRRRLRMFGITQGVGCVYSREPAQKETHRPQQLRDDKQKIARPVLGSLITVTGTFGLRVAAECLNLIAAENNERDNFVKA